MPSNQQPDVDQTKQFLANRMDGSQINFANPEYGLFNPHATFRQLSFINRWAGNIQYEYSVLQHSLLVAELIDEPHLKIYGLIHDVPEDGTGDVTGPFKGFLDMWCNGFVAMHEQRMFAALCNSIGIGAPGTAIQAKVHRADMIARATELRDVVANKKGITIQYEPAKQRIKPMRREELVMQALDLFHVYRELHFDKFGGTQNG
ncbi:hypothetical protein [Maritalea myrionectae]|uniref:hypothetical protein n=1 Tax=Maritalea myrionectae TaxID=454601 RepID=UPI00040B66A5|nr:hypothetical protein [Maritalea myrionectae]